MLRAHSSTTDPGRTKLLIVVGVLAVLGVIALWVNFGGGPDGPPAGTSDAAEVTREGPAVAPAHASARREIVEGRSGDDQRQTAGSVPEGTREKPAESEPPPPPKGMKAETVGEYP